MLKFILIGAALLSSQSVMADFLKTPGGTGKKLLFVVQSNPNGKQVPVTVCLDALAKEKICQTYSASITEVGISPMKYTAIDKTYPHAGIRLDASGYKIEGCKLNKNGFCIFNASTAKATVLKIS